MNQPQDLIQGLIQARTVSRRTFLKAAVAAGGAFALTALSDPFEAARAAPIAGRVPTRPFGRTGLNVPTLSLGTGNDVSGLSMLLPRALELGVTMWDTAPDYNNGRSEKIIGDFLSANPKARKGVILISKSRARSVTGLSDSLDKSLSVLKTGYLDLFMLHGCESPSEMTDEFRSWADKMKKSGKIKLFGGSTHKNQASILQAAADRKYFDAILFAHNYKRSDDKAVQDQITKCEAAGIGLMIMKIRGQGHDDESQAEALLARGLTARGFTENQMKFKAVLEDRRISSACVSMPTAAVLHEFAAAAMDRPVI